VRCPFCKEDKDKVIDSRSSDAGRVIRRRRQCYKRPVSAEQIQQIADKTEEDVFRQFDREVTSAFIGECVMKHLRDVDKVAYIRFASVYREFKDAGELLDEVTRAIQESEPADQLKLFDS